MRERKKEGVNERERERERDLPLQLRRKQKQIKSPYPVCNVPQMISESHNTLAENK